MEDMDPQRVPNIWKGHHKKFWEEQGFIAFIALNWNCYSPIANNKRLQCKVGKLWSIVVSAGGKKSRPIQEHCGNYSNYPEEE